MKLEDFTAGGGPLHPIVTCDRNLDPQVTPGATLMDFLAAHAPPVPEWFIIEMTDPCPRVLDATECLRQQEGWELVAQADRVLLTDWLRDGTYDLAGPGRVVEIGEAAAKLFTSCRKDAKAWGDAMELARTFTWPWYYAQQMLRHRPVTTA